MQEKIGKEKFVNMVSDFGEEFKRRLKELIRMGDYKELPDEKKKEKINNIKNKVLDWILLEYGYPEIKLESSQGR